MDDVASHASVSQTTVSYVLSGRTNGVNISTDTRQRVLNSARDLGYRRNQVARAMVTGKSRILGVFTSPSETEVTLRILSGALESANQNDYVLKVMHLHYYGIDEATISRCVEWQIAGAMTVGVSEANQERLFRVVSGRSLPVVMIDNAPDIESGVCVISDDAHGIQLAYSHLTELGHRKIAFLGGKPCNLSERRLRSFREIADKAGFTAPESWARNSSWGEQPLIEQEAMELLRDASNRPTAIICSGDNIALIVLRIAGLLGLRIPEDLSVTGYSNSDLSSFTTPPLTTVEQPFQAMGATAIQYLVDWDQRVEPENIDDVNLRKEIALPTRLIERASTAPPRS